MREKMRARWTATLAGIAAMALPGCATDDPAQGIGMDEAALETTFTTLTYNVAGLLEPFSSSDPAENTPIISCLIRGYDIVAVQEDFNYHALLYDTCDDHPYRSPTSGGMGFGSGLNTLSTFPYIDWTRVTWDDCDGVDCLTPKGFTMARVRLAEGVYVDVYDLHAQAGAGDAPFGARRANILQLARHVEAESAGNAVIVLGDTNTRYTRAEDNIREFLQRGFRDVWIDEVRGGDVPVQGAEPLTSCSPAMTSPDCEIVDKVLYRSSRAVALRPLEYLVEDQRFVDADGEPLSDHPPVKVTWTVATASDLRLSDTQGGPHGRGFNDVALLPAAPVVTAVSLRSGERLDQIGATLSNGAVLRHGGGGGAAASLDLAGGESLRSIRLCSAERDGRTRIFRAEVTTSAQRVLAGGTGTADCVSYTAPSGWQIVGFHGRSGDEVDRLGVVYAPVTSIPAAPAPVRFINRASALCMDIWNLVMADGTDVAQWTCNGGDWQEWLHDPVSGVVRSRRDPRFCLDNSGWFGDGANVMIWTCTGNANQRFDLDASSGVLRLQSDPRQVVDGSGTSPGSDVITWSDRGGLNQRWDVVP